MMNIFFRLLSRRRFLQAASVMGISFGLFPYFNISLASVEGLFNRIRGKFISSPKPPSEAERKFIDLPVDGSLTSLEKALNTRCTSDGDENPKAFHWGMFDLFHKLHSEDIQKVVDGARIPKIVGGASEVLVSGNEVAFRVQKATDDIQKDWLMIESGMQQQAVCLTCAALGVGMVFRNRGKNGTEISDGKIETIKMKVDAMKPSYGNSHWTAAAPGEPWLKSDLPEPDRKGWQPLMHLLAGASLQHNGVTPVTEAGLGQLLWAARGRTPHLYKSRHCGMTIPTWGGEQNISGVYLIREGRLFQYINETEGKPTHSILPHGSGDLAIHKTVQEKLNANGGLLVFARNEDSGRAFWEVGYQLLNAVLQAAALDLSYQGILLNEPEKALVESAGIKKPAAVLAIR